MTNLLRIKKFSKNFHLMLSFLIVLVPIYYFSYWMFINYWPDTLINVNTESTALTAHALPIKLQIIGFIASLFPASVLLFGILNVRKLFAFYMEGIIFSFDHVLIFKNCAKALMLWTISSICYESAKSVLFSIGNSPGSRVISVGFSSEEMTTLLVSAVVLLIAWVMDEARLLKEDSELII